MYTSTPLFPASIESLLLHLSKNGKRNYKEIINRINSQHDFNFGYDQRNDRYGNLLQLGVVDSLQVVKTSLEDGVSLGCMLLSTDVAIIQAKEYIRKGDGIIKFSYSVEEL